MRPSPARAEPHDSSTWLPLPDLDELPAIDDRIATTSSAPTEGRSAPPPADAPVPPSPARARPHDPSTWFPLPVPDELPSIDDMLTVSPWDARPSPARAEPHDATSWLPLPDVSSLPEAARVSAFPPAPAPAPPEPAATEPPPVAAPEVAGGSRGGPDEGRRARAFATLTRPRWAAVAALIVVTAIGAGLGLDRLADRGSAVEMRVDGQRVSVDSGDATVRQLLRSERVRLGEHDRVLPSLATPLRDGLTVTVLRAFPVNQDLDGDMQTVYTTYSSPSDYIRRDLRSDTVVVRSAPDILQASSTIILRTPHTGRFVVDDTAVDYDIPALDVRELRAQYNVELGAEDYVIDRAGRHVDDLIRLVDGEQYSVVRVGREILRETEVYTEPDERRPDAFMAVGESRVQAGMPGTKSVSYEITRRNGEVVEQKLLSKVPTTLARPTITYYGTKADPMWDKIAECETGGDWSMKGSQYSGGLGFYNGTWDQFGGHEFASNAGSATREEQIIIAEKVRAAVGISGWGCARMLGYVR